MIAKSLEATNPSVSSAGYSRLAKTYYALRGYAMPCLYIENIVNNTIACTFKAPYASIRVWLMLTRSSQSYIEYCAYGMTLPLAHPEDNRAIAFPSETLFIIDCTKPRIT